MNADESRACKTGTAWLIPGPYTSAIISDVKSVEGIYRNGKVELIEPIAEAEGSRVIVTWVQPPGEIDLRDRNIEEGQAADLRRRLAPFSEDWERPDMNAYDELPPR